MDNITIETFLAAYWDFAQWYLIAIGVLCLVLLLLRRPGRALGALVAGVYVTMTVFFLTVRDDMGFTLETALGIVIVFGLVLVAVSYYLVFIRSR